MSNKLHVLNLYIYLSIILCYTFLFSYGQNWLVVSMFSPFLYLLIWIFHLIMGNDIAAQRAAIWLFYCKINGISLKKKCVFVTFCFRDAFCNMVIFFRYMFKYVHAMSLINYRVIVITLLVIHLLLIVVDIELNPGPIGTPDLIENVLSIYHGNIRSLKK
jgi:hypothetical protein